MGVSPKSTAYNIRTIHHHATKCFLEGTERRPGGAPTCSRQETPAWASPQKARFTTSALATTMQPSAFWEAQSPAQAERRLAVGRRRPHGRLPKSTIYNIRTSHHHATKCFLGGTERRPGGAPTCSRQETPAWASPKKARLTTSALATTMQPSAFWDAQSAAQAERRLAVGRRRPHGRLPKKHHTTTKPQIYSARCLLLS